MTRLFGVIGSPIAHSLSPAMHSAAFRARNMDAVYSAFDVPPAHLKPILKALVLAGVEGLNVTVPLKERVIPLIDQVHASAKALGAVNTLVIANRKLVGYNTDAAGFVAALKEMGRLPKAGEQVIVLGAGGAARAVVWALVMMGGLRLTIANRSLPKARSLAAQAKKWRAGQFIEAVSLRSIKVSHADWLINATSLGMKSGDAPPVDVSRLRSSARVYDLIYHRQTELVRAARRRGCVASGGLSMLLYQGAQSFRLWTKLKPPIKVMRQALQKAVSGGTYL